MNLKIWILFFLLTFIQLSCETKNNSKNSSQNIAAVPQNNNQIYNQILDSLNLKIDASRHNAITLAIAKASPAIVGINVTEVKTLEYRNPFWDDPFFRKFFGRDFGVRRQQYKVQGLGSGFLISSDGYIITNHHVAGSASEIVVTLTDGRKFKAEIIGSDRVSDVALLKIDGDGFPYLRFSDSDDIIIGEWVIALGNPFGLFSINAKPTVTVGVVSNKDLNLFNDGRVYKKMIQTDAAISSGNSGGPLVNALGEVIAMNTIIFSTAQDQRGAGSIGIGFAIPINRVKEIVNRLKTYGKINRNFETGIEVKEINERIAKYLDSDVDEGVVIFSIRRNSIAERSGFEPGDIILSINGNKIKTINDYLMEIFDSESGQTLKIDILRANNKKTLSLYLEPK